MCCKDVLKINKNNFTPILILIDLGGSQGNLCISRFGLVRELNSSSLRYSQSIPRLQFLPIYFQYSISFVSHSH